jgi:mRNA-degrading endonuclease HigB of HigAB toxin-antitoxin module
MKDHRRGAFYNRNKIYIRHVLTHQEYDTGKWKK